MKNNNFFDQMEQYGLTLTDEQRSAVERKMREIMSYEPRIGIFGKTGAGKSSLCNALFGQDICPINDVEACTRNPQEVILNMGSKGIKLVDVPGVGESQERDEEYAELYAKLLPELDLVLWLIKADDRAMASDENFYKNVVKPHISQGKPFFFVLNQVDKVEPFRQWNEKAHEPGPVQAQNIQRKVDAVAVQFGLPASKVIPVSAGERYNLVKLVDEIVFALPKEKNITVFKAVDNEFRSAAAGEHVKRSALEVIGDVIGNVIGTVVDGVVEVVHVVADVVDNIKSFFDDLKPWWWPF